VGHSVFDLGHFVTVPLRLSKQFQNPQRRQFACVILARLENMLWHGMTANELSEIRTIRCESEPAKRNRGWNRG
jgi:hypothetical protein